jgi:hypothetical protein
LLPAWHSTGPSVLARAEGSGLTLSDAEALGVAEWVKKNSLIILTKWDKKDSLGLSLLGNDFV